MSIRFSHYFLSILYFLRIFSLIGRNGLMVNINNQYYNLSQKNNLKYTILTSEDSILVENVLKIQIFLLIQEEL